VVVGVDLFGAKLSTKNLDGTVGDDLVRVHVGLSARASLPDDKREMVVQLALDDFVSSLDDSVGDLWLEAVVEVSLSSTLFKDAKGFDDGDRHALTLTSNLEVLERALGLGTPVPVSRNLNRSECVGFLPELLRRGK